MENTENPDSDEFAKEPVKETYCPNIIPMLTNNACDQSLINEVKEEFETEQLKLEHNEIDKEISILLKKIEKMQEESQEVDRQMFNATQIENQAMACFERIGEMIVILKEDSGKIKSDAKNFEIRRMNITRKAEEQKQAKRRNECLSQQIQDLEVAIQKTRELPEPLLDRNLVEDNQELKKKLKLKIQAMQKKRSKKEMTETLKNKKIELLQQIQEKQQNNQVLRQEIQKEKEVLNNTQQEFEQKLHSKRDGLTMAEKHKNELLEELTKLRHRTESQEKNIEQIKTLIAQRELEFQSVKGEIEARKLYIKEVSEEKEQELKAQQDKLLVEEEKLQESLKANEELLTARSKQYDQLTALNQRKFVLMAEVYEKKNKTMTLEYHNADQQKKLDELNEKLKAKMSQIEVLETHQAELDTSLQEVKNNLEKYVLEMAEKREAIGLNHQERKEELLKQQNLDKANSEFLELRLAENLKKIESLTSKNKELERNINWDQTRHNMRQQTAKKLEEKAEEEQASYEKLCAQMEQKKNQASENKKTQALESKKLIFDKQPSTNQTLTQEAPLKEVNTIEAEDGDNDDDSKSASGRKSPGILKSPFKNKQVNISQNKRVKFVGLSSTESSSTGAMEEKTVSLL